MPLLTASWSLKRLCLLESFVHVYLIYSLLQSLWQQDEESKVNTPALHHWFPFEIFFFFFIILKLTSSTFLLQGLSYRPHNIV